MLKPDEEKEKVYDQIHAHWLSGYIAVNQPVL